MKVVTIILVVLLVVVGGFWVYGLTRPSTYHNTASAEFNLTPVQVWFRLHDHAAMGNWHPDIDSVAWVNDKWGTGAEYIDYFSNGQQMRLRTTEYVPFERYTSVVAEEDLPFKGSWTFELQKTGGGTRLTITEDAEIEGGMMRAIYSFMQPDTSSVEKFLVYFPGE